MTPRHIMKTSDDISDADREIAKTYLKPWYSDALVELAAKAFSQVRRETIEALKESRRVWKCEQCKDAFAAICGDCCRKTFTKSIVDGG